MPTFPRCPCGLTPTRTRQLTTRHSVDLRVIQALERNRSVAKLVTKGVQLIEDLPGEGPVAVKGCVIIYNARFFLRRGDEVTRDSRSIALYGDRLNTRVIDGVELIDHTVTLGKRQPISGVEKSLYGMQAGGYREILASPHLCYGESGVEGIVPSNAMLRIQLWVQHVQCAT